MDFITCRLVGPGSFGGFHNFGLGNQLFQVATTLSVAIDNNYIPVFPDMQMDVFGSYTNNIFSKLNITGNKDFIKYVYDNTLFEYNNIPCVPNMELRGHFQSELYFVHNRDIILQYFSPTEIIMEYLLDNYSFIIESKKSVSVHVRRGDYTVLSDKHTLLSETDYYDRAFLKFNDCDFYIFSDDIVWCKNTFDGDNIHFIDCESDIIDLYLMSLCKHNIIANSTFSWWGAWLNTNIDKTVISPRKWFGDSVKLNSNDVIPKQWVKI